MERQIHYYYYPGGVSVSLVKDDDKRLDIKEVAFLTERKGFSRWKSDASLLTAAEINDVYNNATNTVKEWIKWAFDPNHHSNEAMAEKHLVEYYSDYKCDLPQYTEATAERL